ncbi:MAG: site-2 protease family protein [Kiritimatiellales bacterium]|nr:site-2 protease family protein [Kiritimatiellales bacterium]
MFIQQALTDPTLYFSWIIFVIFSICCHEYAHAYTALRFGDDTAACNGHLTLNPLRQMGIQSLIMLALFGIAWGAVPVNDGRVRKAYQRALISFAGPFMNLILCFVFSLLTVIAQATGAKSAVSFLLIGGAVNGMLFVFNILPVPVLDGFAILSAFHSGFEKFAQKHSGIVFLVFILLLWNTPLGSIIFGAGYIVEGGFIRFWHSLAALFF